MHFDRAHCTLLSDVAYGASQTARLRGMYDHTRPQQSVGGNHLCCYHGGHLTDGLTGSTRFWVEQMPLGNLHLCQNVLTATVESLDTVAKHDA